MFKYQVVTTPHLSSTVTFVSKKKVSKRHFLLFFNKQHFIDTGKVPEGLFDPQGHLTVIGKPSHRNRKNDGPNDTKLWRLW